MHPSWAGQSPQNISDQQSTGCVPGQTSRSGQLCTRYVRADLPLLNLSSKAGLDSVLGIGIALISIALLLMCLMAGLLMRMRRKQRRKRCASAKPKLLLIV